MKRRDELEHAATFYTSGLPIKFQGPCYEAFMYGAEWADKNNGKSNKQEEKILTVLKYCRDHTQMMWAATIVGILTDTDFKDAREVLKTFLEKE